MYLNTAKKYILPTIIILFTLILVNVGFLYVKKHDNKYAERLLPHTDGTLVLTDSRMGSHRVTPLTDGWQWQVQAAGEESKGYEPVMIGQYGSFAKAQTNVSPYGEARYRLSISVPERQESCFLLLPEIFSACEIRVNGQLATTLGSTDSKDYKPFVKNIAIPIPAGSSLLEVSTANYTHYYSGITYPPLLGTMGDIQDFIIHQLILYGFLCFFTLGTAMISLTFWFTHRGNWLYLFYGLLSVCFAVYVSYPLTRYMGIHAVRFFYALEDMGFYGMIFCVVMITQLLTGTVQKRTHQAIASLCLLFFILPPVTSFLLAPVFPQWINLSGRLINLYKLGVSVYLILMALRGLFHGRQSFWLLSGNLIFAFGSITDTLTLGLFEPVYGLWQTEYTSFFMVLIFTAMVIRHFHQLTVENRKLTRHLSEEVDRKTSYLTVLLNERRQLLSSIAHDMKAPIAVINAYIDLIRLGDIQIDREAAEYIAIIERKSDSLAKQIMTLQVFNEENSLAEPPGLYPLDDFLHELYEDTAPYAEVKGIYYSLELKQRTAAVSIQYNRVLRAFENIILNAAEHTDAGGHITISARYEKDTVLILINDTGCGISEKDLPRIFDYQFSGKPQGAGGNESRGVGLYFARNTIMEQGGDIEACSEPGKGTELKIRLPLQGLQK